MWQSGLFPAFGSSLGKGGKHFLVEGAEVSRASPVFAPPTVRPGSLSLAALDFCFSLESKFLVNSELCGQKKNNSGDTLGIILRLQG